MTIPSTTRRAGPFYGPMVSGAQIPFSFKVFAATDIAVTIADADGVETAGVLNSSYLVTLNADQTTSPGGYIQYAVGGVVSALPTGYTVAINGAREYSQDTQLTQGSNFNPISVERAFDVLTILVQQLKDAYDRTAKITVLSPSGTDTTLPIPEASSVIGWNEDGTALRNYPPDTSFSTALLESQLASIASAAQGAAKLGYNPALAYASGLGQFLNYTYARTAGEIAAAVTPTNYAYPPLDARRFGVVADGVTDDHVAMSTAFAVITAMGGGELLLPGGTIRLATSSLTLPENLTVTGKGKEATKIKIDGAFVGFSKTYANHTSINRLNLVMRHLAIEGSATALGGVNIELGDNCTFDHVAFTDFQASGSYCLRLKNTYWTLVRRCHFEDFDTYGILMVADAGVGCNATTITDRTQFIGNNEPASICIFATGQNIEISRSDFSGVSNGLHAIVLEGCEGVHIFDNYIERWLGQAVKANTGTANRRVVIENNVLNAVGVPCLNFDHASTNDNIVVHNNRFPDMGAGQTCVDFGNSTDSYEVDNDEGTSNVTDTYTLSQKGVAAYRATFTATLTGVSGTVTGTVRYEKIGKTVTLYLPAILGTSNAATCTLTGMPSLITPARDQFAFLFWRDNGADGSGQLSVTTVGTIVAYKAVGTSGGFTGSGQKGFLGQTFTYSLD